MDLFQQVDEARKQVQNTPLTADEKTVTLHLNFLHQLALLAENHLQDHYREWENACLAKEFLHYAEPLATQGGSEEKLRETGERLAASFEEHPRLKVRLLKFVQQMLKQANGGNEKGNRMPQISREIRDLEKNIALADAGKLDQIQQDCFFNTDPIEWTEKWENCIDEAYQKLEVEQERDDFPMGFCHQYWEAKAKVLKSLGVDWKSPEAMNPDMIFN